MDTIKKIAGAMLAVCVAVRAMPACAQQNDESGYFSKIPFHITDPDNIVPDGTVFTVVLKPEGNAPMPDASAFKAKAGEDYSFGPIGFDEPGNYKYTISESATNDERIILDESVYEVDVAVFIEDDGTMWGATSMHLQGSSRKNETATFENDYGKISTPGDSSTSDSISQGGNDPDSSGGASSGKDSSEDESSDTGTGSETTGTVSSKAENGSDTSSEGGTWIGSITSPNTGGKAALTFSGLMITAAAVAVSFVRRRSCYSDDDDDGGGSS